MSRTPSVIQSDDRFFGLFNYEEINNLGALFQPSVASLINDRMQGENQKEKDILFKKQKFGRYLNPTDMPINSAESTVENSPRLNSTDYVTYQKPNSINITDLISDNTINLESSASKPSLSTTNNRISFEPGEITARSTHHKNELLKNQNVKPRSARLSVSEILASSSAPKARNLRDSLPSAPNSGIPVIRCHNSSSFNIEGSCSLPRTADMSLSKNSSEASFGAAFRSSEFPVLDREDGSSEEFFPAELMHSKLLTDEISWAQKYAAIPAAALSDEAKIKANRPSLMEPKSIDLSSLSNSKINGDPDFSLGNFFNKRSEDLWNIVPCKSPDKFRSAIPLVDADDNGDNCKLGSNMSSATTDTENSTCGGFIPATKKLAIDSNSGSHESKDSGNSSETSYLLSMSAIDRALCNLDIHTDDSEIGVIEKFIDQAKRKSHKNPHKPNEKDIAQQKASINSKQSIDIMNDMKENKENLDPKLQKDYNASETLSFTESLLNSSVLKAYQSTESISKVRSPLSPIENTTPQIIKITDIENLDADIDEWPSTPVMPPNRLRRFRIQKNLSKKLSPLSKNINSQEAETTTSYNVTNSKEDPVKTPTKKSLCSTLLDGDKNSTTTPEFYASPDSSQTNSSSTLLAHKNDSPACHSGRESPAASHVMTPSASPLSNRDGLSSLASSPASSAGHRSSLHMNNSDHRFLNGRGAVYRSNSSPVFSQVGSVEGAPVRTSKSSALASSRCTSSCSNSSEFSHRDGKTIPIKVSVLEISWGSTKLRTTARKSMRVKSTSTKRLVMRLEVHGPGFQMVDTQGNVFTLQPQECRSIMIDFCPTVLGMAIGALSFYSPKGTTTRTDPFISIPLYGYGGHAKVVGHPFLKGPVGAAFLPMGELRELVHPVEKRFKVYNNGPLLGFAFISIDPIGSKHPCLVDSFDIRPRRMLIAPGNTITVRISFRPKREDVKNIAKRISSVLTLANMRIVSGDEGNRQRIRRLMSRMSSDQRSKIASTYMEMVCCEFPDEIDMNELDGFNEKPGVILDLFCGFCIQEVTLTLNKDVLNETVDFSTLSFSDADETVMFRTVCGKSPPPMPRVLEAVDELHEATMTHESQNPNPDDGGERLVSSTQDSQWTVYPNEIKYDFVRERRKEKESTILWIKYACKSRKYFELTCNYKDLFKFDPSNGYLGPDTEEAMIFVTSEYEWPPNHLRNNEVSITVFMENESITLPVKIPDDNFS